MVDIASKIVVAGDSILYAGDQIGFLLGGNEVCFSLSVEDMVNGEFPRAKRDEIRAHRGEIVAHILGLGYEIVEYEDNDDEEDDE